MKFLLTALATIVCLTAFTQNLPEEIAKKSCACMGAPPSKDSVETRFKKCFGPAMTEVIMSNKKIKFEFTVENIQKTIGEAYLLLPAVCPDVAKVFGENRHEKFYGPSASAKANKHFEKGTDLLNEQKYEQAIKSFKLAIKEDENFVAALDNLGICYRHLNQLDEALVCYERSLAIFPEGDFALVNIAVVYTFQNKLDKALSTYEKISQLNPDDPEGHFGAAKIFLMQEKYEEALPRICRAYRIYARENSGYVSDAESIIGLLHTKLKETGKSEFFDATMKEFNIELNVR
jgi:tetratricopeptide (TPR) repeat protein